MKTYALDDVTEPPPALSVLVEEARHEGEGILLLEGSRPVARLIGLEDATEKPCLRPRAGCLPGIWMAPDFDEPLEEFREYME